MPRPRFAAMPLLIGDVLGVNLAILGSLALRFDGQIPPRFLEAYQHNWWPIALVTVVALYLSGLYRGIWRYAGLRVLMSVVRAVTLATGVLVLWSTLAGELAYPRSAVILMWMLAIGIFASLRMSTRLVRELASGFVGSVVQRGAARDHKALIVGAGDSGALLVRDMLDHPARGFVPVGFVDDNPDKQGLEISGVRVLGGCVDIPELVRETGAKKVLIAAPSAPARLTRDILNYCRQVNVECLTLPALHDYLSARNPLTQVRAVRIEDVVGREQVEIDLSQVEAMVRGKCILVTGAGGSIGSEICRQLVRLGPRTLLLLDHAENGLYFCFRDLLEDPERGGVEAHTLVADIKDAPRLDEIFGRWRPDIVFHAAAHKHVPLLEANPSEAVLNNIEGTRNLIRASLASGVTSFVQISTDKAVRPASVMGASKRVCEMLVAANGPAEGLFVSVRFGNVMDSDGSVIPLFRRQIARGGPVTVTHRDARRYFMTISEAVRLVLQAAALGRTGGEIFLLDMGEPVRIMDLAEQMVRLSGLEPGSDIEIREIGLRPGEKMVEQLVSESVPSRETQHERIRAYQGEPVNARILDERIDRLILAARRFDTAAVLGGMREIIPDFHHAGAGLAPLASPPQETPIQVEREQAAMEASRRAAELEPVVARFLGWKRAGDVAAGLVMLPFACVAMLLVSLALSVELGPPLFEQERWIGADRRRRERREPAPDVSIDRRLADRRKRDLLGRPITLWRFRTAPRPGNTAATFAAQNPRVSNFCRRHGLDRLPWIFGLLGGSLSLVGPEPVDPEDAERLSRHAEGLAARFLLRPGWTGLSQMLVPPGRPLEHRLRYDLHYARHASPLLDARIVGRNFMRRLFGTEAATHHHPDAPEPARPRGGNVRATVTTGS